MTKEQETRRNWYASNCGPDSHQQAMIADEDTGKTIAVVYAREDAPLIARACNVHEDLVRAVQNLLDDIAGLKSRDDLQKAVDCERSWFSVVRALDLLDDIRDAQQQN